MINKFESYNDLKIYTNNLSDTTLKYFESIKKLRVLVDKGDFTEEYYEKQCQRLKLLAGELSSCSLLKKDILNSKTNEKLIDIILSKLNENNKYSIRVMQTSGYNSVYELDKDFYEINTTTNNKLLYSVFLVNNAILNDNLAERIHNQEEYDELTKSGMLIDLNSRLISIKKEDIREYFKSKTINLGSIVGLSEEIKNQIREYLFNNYKNEYLETETKQKVK